MSGFDCKVVCLSRMKWPDLIVENGIERRGYAVLEIGTAVMASDQLTDLVPLVRKSV